MLTPLPLSQLKQVLSETFVNMLQDFIHDCYKLK